MRKRMGVHRYSTNLSAPLATATILILAAPQLALALNTSVTSIQGNFSRILLDPTRPRLYLADVDHGSILVVNSTSGVQISSVYVGDGPNGMDISANGEELYVTHSFAPTLVVVSLSTLSVSRTIDLSAGAFDVAAGRVGRAYVTTAGLGHPMIVDTVSNKEVGSIDAGGEIFGGRVKSSSSHEFLYVVSSNFPATVYRFLVRSDNPSLVSELKGDGIQAWIDRFVPSPDGLRLYVASSIAEPQVLNTSDWSAIGPLRSEYGPGWVSLDSAGGLLLATYSYQRRAVLFNTTNFLPVWTFNATNQGLPSLQQLSADGSIAFIVVGRTLEIQPTGVVDSGPVPTESPDLTPPAWPPGSIVRASYTSQTSLNVTWSKAKDFTGVAAYRIVLDNKTVATVVGGSRSFLLSGLSPSTRFDLRVVAGDYSDNWSTGGPTLVIDTSVLFSSLALSINRPSVSVGESVSIHAALVDASGPVVGQSVGFLFQGETIATGITNSSGVVAVNYSANLWPGTYRFQAYFMETSSHHGANGSATLTVTLIQPSISLDLPSRLTQDSEFSFSAILVDKSWQPLAGEIVWFIVNGELIGTAETDSSGRASIELTPTSAGNATFQGKFMGRGNYSGVSSSILSVDVAPSFYRQADSVTRYMPITTAIAIGVLTSIMAVRTKHQEVWRERGFLYSIWLGVSILLSMIAAIGYLILASVSSGVLPTEVQFVLYGYGTAAALTGFLQVLLIKWKRWAFYGLMGMGFFLFFSNLAFGVSLVVALPGLIGVGVLYVVIELGDKSHLLE